MRFLLDTPGSALECDYSLSGTCIPGLENTSIAGSTTAVIILHPWGRLGGCMDDPTVEAQYSAALQSGYTALRYNSRCVFTSLLLYSIPAPLCCRCAGRSRNKRRSSSPDADDLVAVCQHVLSTPPPSLPHGESTYWEPPKQLVLVGYSYGSCVAAQALDRVPEVVAYVSIGFPLGFLPRWFLGSADDWRALMASPVPKLLVMGDVDNFTSLSTLQTAVAEHDAIPGTGPLTVKIIRGADHFFFDQQPQVAAMVQEWLGQQLSSSGALAAAEATATAAVESVAGT